MSLRRLLAAIAAAIGLTAAPALAQTTAPTPVITKALPKWSLASPCTPMNCSGIYGGFNLSGYGASIPGVGGFAGGGLVGGQIGYQFWSGGWFFGAEAFCDYDATTAASTANQSRWMCGQVVKLGGALSGLLGQAPAAPAGGSQAPVPIALPSGLQNMMSAPYAQAGAVQRPWATGWGIGTGLDIALVANWNLDLSYIYINYGSQPVTVPSSENLFRIGLNYKL